MKGKNYIMKRKLSMLLSIILVTTSFIGCDEQDNQINNQQEVTTSQDELNPSTPDRWDSITDDYTVVIDEDNEFMTQEETTFVEVDEVDEESVIEEDNETPEATSVPQIQQVPDEIKEGKIEQTSNTTNKVDKVPESTDIIVPPTVADVDPVPVSASHMYNQKKVVELYSYDINNYTMSKFDVNITVGNVNNDSNVSTVNQIINTLGQYESITPNKYAYFILTIDDTNQYHKEYVFIDESNQVLADGIKNQKTSEVFPSWLIHMSTENLTSATISNTTGKNDTITDVSLLGGLASSLKLYLPVTSTDNVTDGYAMRIPTSTSSDFTSIKLEFKNGVYYDLQIVGNTLQIYTSDLDKTVDYSIDGKIADKLMSIYN